jgi:hypothetical protein
MHLHARDDVKTDTVIVTEWVTEWFLPDEKPTSTTIATPTASEISLTSTSTIISTTSALPTTADSSAGLGAMFVEEPSTTSTTTQSSTTDLPDSTTPAPIVGGGPGAETVGGYRIFTVVNSHTAAISTSHDDTVGTPTSNGGELAPGTMAPGAMATFAAPPGWVGNIAYGDASFPIGPSDSLIEANFVEWFGSLRADFDISYV